MRQYDPGLPLIFSHVPKTAGVSVRSKFVDWFGKNLLTHYKPHSEPVAKHDLQNPPVPNKPVVVFGHFNRRRGFGIEQYYPQVNQFIAIVREPWEREISAYFYRLGNVEKNPIFKEITKISLEEYLATWPNKYPNFAPTLSTYLPLPCDLNNYREMIESQFVEIGISEQLPESMKRISEKLGLQLDISDLPHLNTSRRTVQIPMHIKKDFEARNPLDYAIYNYVREKFD